MSEIIKRIFDKHKSNHVKSWSVPLYNQQSQIIKNLKRYNSHQMENFQINLTF